ncbi:MAG TPA: hypothetical protein VGF45_09520 [Polyangia bacterium]
MRSVLVAVPFLAALLWSVDPGGARAAAPASQIIRAGHGQASTDAREEIVKKLRALAESQLPIEKSVASLLAPVEWQPGDLPARRDARLVPNGFIASGTVSQFVDDTVATANLQKGLGLALQDLEAILMDYPMYVGRTLVHWESGEGDAYFLKIANIEYRFRVPAGELTLIEKVQIPFEKPDQRKLAMQEAYDAAAGKAQRRVLIEAVQITRKLSRDWTNEVSLRKRHLRRTTDESRGADPTKQPTSKSTGKSPGPKAATSGTPSGSPTWP